MSQENSNPKTHTDGIVALVTGGTGAIGTMISQSLYNSGFRVVAAYNKGGNHDSALAWQEQQRALGFEIQVAYSDVTDYDSCGVLVQSVHEMYGKIGVLVNNAGITSDSTLKKMTSKQWSNVLETNLNSVFNVTQQVINDMLENKYGRIINISSINGQKGQFGQCNYAAAKAGMHGFTKSLAQETARKGITVNTVSPGYINTSMMQDVPEKVLEQIISQIPVGRLGEADEIARLVAFLAREDSGFITGADISINGGQHMS